MFAIDILLVALPIGVTVSVLTTGEGRRRGLADTVAMAPFAVRRVVVGLGMLRDLVFGVELWGHRLKVT